MEPTNLVEQSYWDAEYRRCAADLPAPNREIETWIRRYIPRANGSCFEIGCYPGTYLAVLGEMGYVLHGIDRTPNTSDLEARFVQQGYRVGDIRQGDFFAVPATEPYDVVLSLGFIEHFSDWKTVLRKTASLVKPGGYLVLETPNFSGLVQRAAHWIGNPSHFYQHNLRAMRPRAWAAVLEEAGFSVLGVDYLGGLEFGVPPCSRNAFQRGFMWCANRLKWRLAKYFRRPRPAYSPFCGLIARRNP